MAWGTRYRRYRVQGLGFQGLGLRAHGLGFWMQELGFENFRCRVLGLGFSYGVWV